MSTLPAAWVEADPFWNRPAPVTTQAGRNERKRRAERLNEETSPHKVPVRSGRTCPAGCVLALFAGILTTSGGRLGRPPAMGRAARRVQVS